MPSMNRPRQAAPSRYVAPAEAIQSRPRCCGAGEMEPTSLGRFVTRRLPIRKGPSTRADGIRCLGCFVDPRCRGNAFLRTPWPGRDGARPSKRLMEGHASRWRATLRRGRDCRLALALARTRRSASLQATAGQAAPLGRPHPLRPQPTLSINRPRHLSPGLRVLVMLPTPHASYQPRQERVVAYGYAQAPAA
jgi:hypothetical protein